MEAAVPPYHSDAAAAASAVGELYLYVKQLTARIAELAEQANKLDDALIEATRRGTELDEQLASAHAHNDELRTRIDKLEDELRQTLEDEADCRCDR